MMKRGKGIRIAGLQNGRKVKPEPKWVLHLLIREQEESSKVGQLDRNQFRSDLSLLLLAQVSLEAASRDLLALQEISCHQKKRSAEILNLLLRDLSEIGSVLGTSELRAVSETAAVNFFHEAEEVQRSSICCVCLLR